MYTIFQHLVSSLNINVDIAEWWNKENTSPFAHITSTWSVCISTWVRPSSLPARCTEAVNMIIFAGVVFLQSSTFSTNSILSYLIHHFVYNILPWTYTLTNNPHPIIVIHFYFNMRKYMFGKNVYFHNIHTTWTSSQWIDPPARGHYGTETSKEMGLFFF